MGKKILALLALLVALIIYTVYSFDYKTILNEEGSFTSKIAENVNKLKDKVMSSSETNNANFELTKQNNQIILNGTFKDNEQATKLFDTLNVNKLGNVSINKNVTIEDSYAKQIASLVMPLKDFFTNDSSLSVKDGKINLNGKLKDAKFADIVKSTIEKSGLDINSNFDIPEEKQNITSEDIKRKAIPKPVKPKEIPEIEQVQNQINSIISEQKIRFQRASTKITKSSKITIKEIAQIMKKHRKLYLEIGGHTDSRGRASLNKKISQKRADSVRKLLIKEGISSRRLTAIGYGEDFPIAKDDEDGLSEKNRRVEFKVLGEKR